MKAIVTFAFLLCSSMVSMAQVSQTGASGNTTQSTGYIPSGGNERLQNRPDSTHNGDTTYMQQQWNSGASQNQKKSPAKTTKKKK